MSTFGTMTVLPNPISYLIALAGTEVTGSRRWIDLSDCQYGMVQYSASLSISVRIEYSKDLGVTWSTLVPEDNRLGTDPICSGWWNLPDLCRSQMILIRAFSLGTGVLTTISFVEFSYR